MTDRTVHRDSPSLENLRAAARSAMKKTRGFSPEQEAMFIGDGQTLRAHLLAKWQRLLGPLVQERTPAAQETQIPRGTASIVVDIQDHEFGSGAQDPDKIDPLDRVRHMGIVRGTTRGSGKLAALRHRPREILLQIQEAAFVRQTLPKEQEDE